MIADYDGPHAGSVGDASILRRSNIEARLQAIVDEVGHVATLYGDGAYPRTDLLHRLFKGNISASEAAFNEATSGYPRAMEWIFG
eukprot:scaffold656_cov403-Pavlova_lutheri.AAC.3